MYYDGVRRIQEVVTDPVLDLQSALASGDAHLVALASLIAAHQGSTGGAPLDGDAAPLELLSSQGEDGTPVPTDAPRLDREYLWGPGDGPGGVDELFAQFDPSRRAWWVLQDAGGDVAAVCETPTITNLPARVAAQFTYDAYGQVQTADHLLPHPFVRAGHKGLFADRLDAGVADALAQGTEWNAASGAETPRLTPFATLVYYTDST